MTDGSMDADRRKVPSARNNKNCMFQIRLAFRFIFFPVAFAVLGVENKAHINMYIYLHIYLSRIWGKICSLWVRLTWYLVGELKLELFIYLYF